MNILAIGLKYNNKRKIKGLEQMAVLYIASLAWIPAFFFPFDLTVLTHKYLESDVSAMFIAFSQVVVVLFTSFIMKGSIAYLDKRELSMNSCFIALICSAGLFVAESIWVCLGLKVIFSFCMGVLLSCSYCLVSYYDHPERLIAKTLLALTVVATVTTFTLPLVIERLGLAGVFFMQGMLVLLGLIVSGKMPLAILANQIDER